MEAGEVGGQRVVGLARDVALETADDLGLGLAFGCSALGVGARAGAVAQAADGDQVQRAVGVAVAAVVETVAGGLARGRRDRTGAAQRGERALTAQALDVLPGADEQLSGVAGRDAEQRVGGILSVVMLRASFDVFSGHVLARCAIATLTIWASGAATAGIQAAAGPAGTALVILVFVILGNSASGGPFARPLLPGLWSTIGGVLPPGASVDLARSALFFDGARIAGPILVLVAWAALGTLLALALGGRITNPVDIEAEAAAGAAV
jgi:hypothetical protein